MNPHLWWMFFLGTVLICGSPGPNMLQVMAMSARHGFRRTFFGMVGCFIPVFIYICISLAGVGALLEVFPLAFDILRYAGAAYLIYLGIMAWRENPVSRDSGCAGSESLSRFAGSKHIFLRSFMVGISNPKAMLFATAYFPQFLDPNTPQAMQFVILLATFSVVEISWYMIYAMSGSRLAKVMQNAKTQRLFNRLTGSLFAFFGVMLIAKTR